MNPVARITPAAKALIMKKISFSGLRAGTFLPSKGMHTPTALATRMQAIEPSLYFSAALLLSFSLTSASHVQSQHMLGRRRMRTKQISKILKEHA
jgi:hypothetical protein